MTALIPSLQTAGKDATANRASFVLQVSVMVVNNVVWVVFWAFFFQRIGTVKGWSLADVLLLFSIICSAAGIAFGVFANCRRLGGMVAEGDLDEVLMLPVSPLRYVLTTRINPSNIGDFVFGVGLFVVACHPTLMRSALYFFGVTCGAVVLTAFIALAGSLSFFAGGKGNQTDSAFNAIVLFASYPIDFFTGAVKVILYTAIPAAFVSGLPVGLIRHFDAGTMAIDLAVTIAFAALSTAVFSLGLRLYSSGSMWKT